MQKSEITKEKLFQTAIEIISREGFENATMRDITAKVGLSPGAAYYYFESKEDFVYEYYKKSHEDHEKALGDFLKTERAFKKRLHKVVTCKIELALPYKKAAIALYRVAANPESPLSPFSEQSQELRIKCLNIFKDVVTGSRERFHPELRGLLPEYLWLYQMGVILFWIYDRSENSKKTFEFIDKTVPLISLMNRLLQNPFLIPFRKRILSILKDFIPRENTATRKKEEFYEKKSCP